MAVAIVAAKMAIAKVQEERQRRYEESIMTEEQKRALKEKQQKIREEKKRRDRLQRFEKYKQLAVFHHHEPIIRFCGELANSFYFQSFMIFVICIAGILVGINTYKIKNETLKYVVTALELVIVIIFILDFSKTYFLKRLCGEIGRHARLKTLSF